MKKVLPFIQWISFVLFLTVWAYIGINLIDGKYEFTAAAYIAGICFTVLFVSVLLRILSSRCPHCGKPTMMYGQYCPHCGKKTDED